jgi:hypothetical protein
VFHWHLDGLRQRLVEKLGHGNNATVVGQPAVNVGFDIDAPGANIADHEIRTLCRPGSKVPAGAARSRSPAPSRCFAWSRAAAASGDDDGVDADGRLDNHQPPKQDVGYPRRVPLLRV